MGSAHDDAVVVGELRVEGVVFVEAVIPHGGPEVVAFESEDQFEDVFVKLVVVGSEFFFNQAGEGGGFIIEKDAAVFHRGRALDQRNFSGLHVVSIGVVLGWEHRPRNTGGTPICAERS